MVKKILRISDQFFFLSSLEYIDILKGRRRLAKGPRGGGGGFHGNE